MDFKEIKKITAFARKAGLKSLKFNGFEIEFSDQAVPPTKKRLKIVEDEVGPSIPQEPNLEQINDYIYGNTQEVG